MNSRKFSKNRSILEGLNVIKISFAGLMIALFAALPMVISQINTSSTDSRSNAEIRYPQCDSLNPCPTATATPTPDCSLTPLPPACKTGLIQSWVVAPNGGEIVYGNTELQFFAKNTSDPSAKFGFTMDLLKGTQFVKNLFVVASTQQITDRDGIRSKFVDLTGITEGTDYKLKLTTVDANGQNAVIDYSDSFFTISQNTARPTFVSLAPGPDIVVNQRYTYTPTISSNRPYTIAAPTLPAWLKLDAASKTIDGTPTATGIYPIVLVATDDFGRQSSQVFSLNVKTSLSTASTTTPKPTATKAAPTTKANQTTPTPTPTLDPKTGGSTPTYTVSDIGIKLPTGDRLSKSDSKITTTMPDALASQVTTMVMEISREGNSWEKVYEGKSLSTSLDTEKYDGGDYYLRFTYTLADGNKEVKTYGPVHIVKQNTDQAALDVTIRDLKPQESEKITDRKPVISSTFQKPAGANIDLKSFKLTIDGLDLTSNPNAKLNNFSFAYTPDADMALGKHEVTVEIAAENANPTKRTWKFEIVQPESQIAKDQSLARKNRVLIGVAIGIVILIFVLSLWAIALARKEKMYYIDDERTIVERPPL